MTARPFTTSETDTGLKLTSLAINGEDVLAVAKFNDEFWADRINLEVIDTCTKDGLKELAVIKGVEGWDVYTLFRFKDGKVSQYCTIDDPDEIVSQKKKNTVSIKDYVYVYGIGNIRVTLTAKVKSGKLKYTNSYITPNKDNAKVTFKTNRKITLYSDENITEKIGTVKKGAKIKLVKMVKDEEGSYTRICVKSNGVTGWIDTTVYDDFIINNPPVWE